MNQSCKPELGKAGCRFQKNSSYSYLECYTNLPKTIYTLLPNFSWCFFTVAPPCTSILIFPDKSSLPLLNVNGEWRVPPSVFYCANYHVGCDKLIAQRIRESLFVTLITLTALRCHINNHQCVIGQQLYCDIYIQPSFSSVMDFYLQVDKDMSSVRVRYLVMCLFPLCLKSIDLWKV